MALPAQIRSRKCHGLILEELRHFAKNINARLHRSTVRLAHDAMVFTDTHYSGMSELENDPAYKLFIDDLRSFENSNGDWYFKFSDESERIRINKFHIQGKICKVTGLDGEILIVSDDTAKAKATRSARTPGDFSWVKTDVYCSMIGNLLSNGKLPHFNIIKLAKIDNEFLKQMWPFEVMELKHFMAKKISTQVPV